MVEDALIVAEQAFDPAAYAYVVHSACWVGEEVPLDFELVLVPVFRQILSLTS